MEQDNHSTLSYLYKRLEEHAGIPLSMGDKFLIQNWLTELREGLLNGKYKASSEEEKMLPVEDLIRTYAVSMFDDFAFKFFHENTMLKSWIEHEENRAEFTTKAYLKFYKK